MESQAIPRPEVWSDTMSPKPEQCSPYLVAELARRAQWPLGAYMRKTGRVTRARMGAGPNSKLAKQTRTDLLFDSPLSSAKPPK